MRKGRQVDRNWNIRKYKGDLALYAYCKCGFYYCCSKLVGPKIEIDPHKLYHYCPNCGAHKKYYNERARLMNKFQYE